MKNYAGREIPAKIAGLEKFKIYNGEFATKPEGRLSGAVRASIKPDESKICANIEDAVKKSGLKDGMTISFHHHFRGGDYIINMVVDILAKMGFKNLRLVASSLNALHSPLIEHIKNGVISGIASSGLRGELAEAVSRGILKTPVIIRSHGGRARAIEAGDEKIDVAFLGAPSSDEYGNANGHGKAVCGSLGYAIMDAKYADKVIVITDNVVPFPNTPASFQQTQVDFVVEVEEIGDPSKIGGKETRFTKNPRDLLIADYAAKVIMNSEYFQDGFSFQTGSGGASLAVSRVLRGEMEKRGIKASFSLGGITKPMVEMHEAGLIGKLFDVQSFDLIAANSVFRNKDHHEVDASYYANPHNKGCIANKLDIVILSALEIDTDFNVNVITGSDGVIRGASGGHSDTAASAKLSIIVAPLIRGRIPTVVKSVLNVVTPGASIDVLVTDRGVAVNKGNEALAETLRNANIPVFTIEELCAKAEKMTGKPEAIEYEEKVIGIVEYRDGTVLDVIRQIKE